jgi:hypothetical protein
MSLLIRTTLVVSFLLMSGVVVRAQELSTEEDLEKSPVGETKNAQITNSRVVRINPETEGIESSERLVENFVENIGKKATQERATQIDFVLEVFLELNVSSSQTQEVLISGVDRFIETAIEGARIIKPQSPHVLRRLVDSIRDDTYVEIVSRMANPKLIENPELFDAEVDFLIERLELVQDTLEIKGGVELDLVLEKEALIASFREYGAALVEAHRRLLESNLLSAAIDSDRDGLSDFTEDIITRTDPFKKSTIGGPSTDGESLLLGKNASSLDLEDTLYTDVSQSSTSAYLALSRVDHIEQQKNINNDSGSIALQGLSVPGSVVYGYIYPHNIVFISQTDAFGLWEHTLAQDLEDGEYQIHIAHLEADGNPVTRSKSFTFIHKEGTTFLEGKPLPVVTLLPPDVPDPLPNPEGVRDDSSFLGKGALAEFIREFFLIIVGGLSLLGIFVSIVLVKSGFHKRAGTYYSAMSPDGPVVNQAKGKTLYGSLDTEEEDVD